MISRTMVAKGPHCLFAELDSLVRKALREITFSIAFELALDTHVVDGLAFQQSAAEPSPSNEWTLGLQVMKQYGRNNVWVVAGLQLFLYSQRGFIAARWDLGRSKR